MTRIPSPGIATGTAILILTCLLLWLPMMGPAHAQVATARILVLHGVWKNDFWEYEFDRSFVNTLDEFGDQDIHVSSQYLGLNRALPAASRERLLVNINAIIREQEVDLIVGVQPEAIDFLLDLEVVNSLPSLLVLPNEANLPQPPLERQSIILSASREAMSRTLEEIFLLLPDTTEINVIAGNSDGDRVYLERFRELAAAWEDRARFDYSIGESRENIAVNAGAMPANSVVFTLPYNAFGPNRESVASESLALLAEESAVPVFGIYDSQLDYGITGGHMTSVQDYALRAAEASLALLRGEPASVQQGRASSFYNWDAIRRFDLPVERLRYPITVANQPSSLFDDYPFLSALGINLILLLIICLAFMSWMYKRSLTARAKISESERQLKDSEERYRLLADNAGDVIWVVEEDTPYLKYCSPANERITGYTAEESMTIHFREMLSAGDLENLNRGMMKADRDPVVQEIKLRHKDGRWVWCEIVVQPAKVMSHGKRQWIGITRDITKRRESEHERARLEDQVRQSQKFESLGTLAGGIAHDFNNILTVIIGIADMLRLEFKDQPSSQRLLNRLLSASDKAKALVQQILTFSRQSKGEKAVISVADLIDESLQLLQSGKPPNVSLTANIASRDINVLADANQLEQVIINLITNALEAVPPRGGVITVDLFTKSIDHYYCATHGELKPADYVGIRISDNGVGMTEEQQRQVFDPFYTSKELGNGMGLAIVHGIMMDHGGAIDLQSEVNAGTTIQLYLPLADGDAETRSAPSERELAAPEGLKVLIVDDQEEVLDVASAMLARLGNECICTSSPRQAMEIIKQLAGEIGLVITDFSMPGLTGRDILNFCADHYPDLPVIISTGYGDKVTQTDTWNAQPVCILDKPYDLSKLREAIDQALTPA